MIAEDRTRSPSPSTSCTSDDEYNKDTARVYFGPFKTPEKRFASIAAIPGMKTEVTTMSTLQDTPKQSEQRSRSSSLLSSTGSDEFRDVERLVGLGEEGETNRMHIGTPQPNSLLDDEPSSALAHRLLRALDNPSPPPDHTHLPEENDADGADADEEDEVDFTGEGEGVPIAPIFFPTANTSQTPSLRPVGQTNDMSEVDLMTFDSFDDRLETPAPLPTPSADTPHSPFSFPIATVLPLNETRQEDSESPHAHSNMNILIDLQDEEQEINISLLADRQRRGEIEGVGGQIVVPSIRSTSTEKTANMMPVDPPDLPMDPRVHSPKGGEVTEVVPEEFHTPLRRSLRPRKSATPHILKFLAVDSPDKDRNSADPTPHPNTQTRKSRKGKERVESPFKSMVLMETEDAPMADPKPPKLDENQPESKIHRRYSRSPVRQEFGRELGSLSPNSTKLLARLVSSSPAAATSESTPLTTTEHSAEAPAPTPDAPLPSTSQAVQTASALSSIIESRSNSQAPIPSPMHVSTTPRRLHARSPSRPRLQPVPLDDPTRTPARRIPLQHAVAEGLISPQKLSQMQTGTPASYSIFSGQPMPVLNTSLKGDQSPARRVFAGPPVSGPSGSKIAPRSDNLTKGKAELRGPSTDESSSWPAVVTSSQATTSALRQAKLPFALAPSKAPLGRESDAVKSAEASIPTSPGKSLLKQTTSRIPRKKPYSRPKPSALFAEQIVAKKNIPIRASKGAADASASKQPMVKSRAIIGVQNEPTSSMVRFTRAVELIKPATNASAAPNSDSPPPDSTDSPPDTTSDNNDAPTVGKLKRKRLDPKTMTKSSSRPTGMLRQVPSITPSSESNVMQPTASSSLRATKPPPSAKIPTQKPTVIKFRRVMAPVPSVLPEPFAAPEGQPHPPTPPSHHAHIERNSLECAPEQVLPPSEDIILSSPVKEKPEPSLPQPPSFSQLVFVMEPAPPVSPLPDLVTNITIEELGPNVRRTTRPRKPMQVQFVNDMSSNVNSTSNSNTTRPLQRRRTNVAQSLRSDADDVFSGMSMNALKTLTANNTVRNQYYAVAKLETEVVRKDGLRPESPAVKTKTIVQRQQEEKAKQREERAARRARRCVNGDSLSNSGEGGANDDLEYRSPSPLDRTAGAQAVEALLVKHRRGAGDEEDYETPARRFDKEMDGKRRVKWDRGLYTEVFLDEVVLGTRVRSKADGTTKGCLAPTAKTLRLDTLGNLVDAEAPLTDLTQENIVVKKFMYDDDFEGVEQPTAPVVRNTRSKSKKSKS